MSDQVDHNAVSTPRHLWAVGIFALLWSAMGAIDYFMTQTGNEAYMSEFTPEQLAFFYGMPAWADATWAIAVWGGVLGALLLLFRQRYAVWVPERCSSGGCWPDSTPVFSNRRLAPQSIGESPQRLRRDSLYDPAPAS